MLEALVIYGVFYLFSALFFDREVGCMATIAFFVVLGLNLGYCDLKNEWTPWIVMAQLTVFGFGSLFLRDHMKKERDAELAAKNADPLIPALYWANREPDSELEARLRRHLEN